jgi:hypothetical protein
VRWAQKRVNFQTWARASRKNGHFIQACLNAGVQFWPGNLSVKEKPGINSPVERGVSVQSGVKLRMVPATVYLHISDFRLTSVISLAALLN